MLNKKGGIDEAEDPRTAAIRELREETGVSSAEILAEVKNFSHFFRLSRFGLLLLDCI